MTIKYDEIERALFGPDHESNKESRRVSKIAGFSYIYGGTFTGITESPTGRKKRTNVPYKDIIQQRVLTSGEQHANHKDITTSKDGSDRVSHMSSDDSDQCGEHSQASP